jgi:hypothetical protein
MRMLAMTSALTSMVSRSVSTDFLATYAATSRWATSEEAFLAISHSVL